MNVTSIKNKGQPRRVVDLAALAEELAYLCQGADQDHPSGAPGRRELAVESEKFDASY